MKKVVAIVGPTASGKSELAIEVADRVGAEIISCDSVQVYRGLDIGSGKVRADERQAASGNWIEHHMLDVCDPRQEYTTCDYQRDARACIESILGMGRIPILCGGTGLYFRSAVDDYRYAQEEDEVKKDRENYYQEILLKDGRESLHRLLERRSPDLARKYHQNNERRVIRALVRMDLGAREIAQTGPEPYYQVLAYGLLVNRKLLYERINERVDRMLQSGLLEETQNLLRAGVTKDHKIMNTLGYRHMLLYLNNELDWDEAVRQMKRDTRHYAKRQYTWFNRDKRIQWLNYDCDLERAEALRVIVEGILDFFKK